MAVLAKGISGRWTFLDMNSYFATCEQQAKEDLRGRPVAVVPIDVEHTCCIAASYEAKLFGVGTGTTVGEARRLCPNLVVVEARPKMYRRVHFAIVAAVEQVAPIEEVLSVDEMIIRPWNNEKTLADSLRLGQRVQDAIRQQVGEWMTCSVGIASNALLAKVASDWQKPRGLSVVSPDDIPYKFYRMELTDWPGIAKGMEKRFFHAGVRTTEAMYRLSLREMRGVFGSIVGDRWWRAIRGEPVALPPVKRWQIGHGSVLAPELRTPEGAWSVACRLVERAAQRLRYDAYYASRLWVSVAGYSEKGWTKAIRFEPSNKTALFLEALRRLWSDEVQRPSHVNIALQQILPARDVVLSLWDDPRQARLDQAVDALNQRFGRGTVTVAAALLAKSHLARGEDRISFGCPRTMG